MDFIKDLYEGRMLRDQNNARVLTYTDCCERTFLSLLILEVMRLYPRYQKIAKSYAGKTVGHTNYNFFRTNGTDLYNLVYFIMGDEVALNKLKDPGAAKKLRDKTVFPVLTFNRYLHQLTHDSRPTSPSEAFTKIESALNISNSDYKAIRRNIVNLKTLPLQDKTKTISRLLLAARAKLRNSDLITDFEKLVADKNLETDIKDSEPTVSVPDLSDPTSQLMYYQYIVGKENLALTRMFMQMAKDGKSIPSQYVKGYLPAIKMIDDIVSGGPSYIAALRALHQRAKNSNK